MQLKNREPIEIKLQKARSENQSLRQKIAFYKRECKRYERSIKKRDLLFHFLPAGIVLIQQDKIIEINDTLLTQLGFGYEEVIGCDFLDFVHPDQRPVMYEFLNSWATGKNPSDQIDAYLIKKDAHSILYDIKMNPVRVHNRKAFLLNLTRLEKRIELEEANIRSKKTKALVTMASGLKGPLRFHTDFITSGINDLKKFAEPGNNDPSPVLKRMEKSSRELYSIAGELETWAGLYDPGFRGISFDLNGCVKEAVSFAMEAWEKGLENPYKKTVLRTYLRSSSLITGDPALFREVVIHLIRNAVESIPDGGEILITTEDTAGTGHIYIQDSGIGIPEENREKVFDPFFTTKGPDSKGLGLSLAYAIIKRHKGDIRISGQEGHGTVVHIHLPITGPEKESRPGTGRMKIEEAQVLIVQDEAVARGLLSYLLLTKGCKVETAADGVEGLGKLKRKDWNLMIADAEALHMEGEVFIKKCKDLHPDLSFVLITRDEESMNPSPDHPSATDLKVKKPLVMNNLVKRVMELLAAG
jgi:PAS domain S-box-containing protein